MLNLRLRDEFHGIRTKGTAVDFDIQSKTSALSIPAVEFLKITYPSHDILKTIENIQIGKTRPIVILGDRGQGKSHLLATVYHLMNEPEVGKQWLIDWSGKINDNAFGNLSVRPDCKIIAESLHLQRYKHLWDVLFECHPSGQRIRGKWQAMQTDVPSYDLLLELFTDKPTVLILDEFQTWYDGLTNTKQYPWRNWAFNFVQLLAEIAERNSGLLTLIVSIRDGQSDAFQQINRMNPVRIDFKGPEAKKDRRRLLLHRLFENRNQISRDKIQQVVNTHINEFFRLFQIPQTDQEIHREEFNESWPFSPHLLNLLDDQVLVAIEAQETRDLIRILVDIFKNSIDRHVITAADFSINNPKSGVASLLDSVANHLHRDLREVALRNLEAVQGTTRNWKKEISHCEELIGSLWLRSLTMGNTAGAEAKQLQLDITQDERIDDNVFSGELSTIKENSFNIHEVAGRLLFKNEENPLAKLYAYAKNDKLFQVGEDVDFLAKEIRMMLCGSGTISQTDRVIVLKREWRDHPWQDQEQGDHPAAWDSRLTTIVMPEYPNEFDKTLGTWIKKHLPHHRNAVRFLFPKQEFSEFYDNTTLMNQARAVYLADQYAANGEAVYKPLKAKLEKELLEKLKDMFDRYAILDIWDFEEPAKCRFHIEGHGKRGDKILDEMEKQICDNLFVPEDFEEFVLQLADNGDSVDKLLKELKEPRTQQMSCIPWIGEAKIKDKLWSLCCEGKIAINIQGNVYQVLPGASNETPLGKKQNMLGQGQVLKATTLHRPQLQPVSTGVIVQEPGGATVATYAKTIANHDGNKSLTGDEITNPFLQPTPEKNATFQTTVHKSDQTSGLNLRGKLEQWGIGHSMTVFHVKFETSQMTGAQIQELIKHLPDGVKFSLELEKEVKE